MTDHRLLFVFKKPPARIFELDPSEIRKWIMAEREAKAKASAEFKDAWDKRGVFGVVALPFSQSQLVPPPLYTISEARAKSHVLRRQGSWLGCVALLLGFAVVWLLIVHGVPPGWWTLGVLVGLSLIARIAPWNGVRLRVEALQYGSPRILKGISNWMLSRDEIQLRGHDDAERLVALLTSRMKAVSEVLASKEE